MTFASSHDLQPRHGARYVFHRLAGAPNPAYAVAIHPADGVVHRLGLTWDEGGEARVEPSGDLAVDPAVLDQVLKLARVLRADLPERLTRWR